SLSSSRRDRYIVRKIFSISSRLSFGSSRSRCFGGFAGFRTAGETGLMTVTGAGLGSALATDLAVKDFSGSSPSVFLTSLRTLVSLINAFSRIAAKYLLNISRLRHSKNRFSKFDDILLPSPDGHAPSRLRFRADKFGALCRPASYARKRWPTCRTRYLR